MSEWKPLTNRDRENTSKAAKKTTNCVLMIEKLVLGPATRGQDKTMFLSNNLQNMLNIGHKGGSNFNFYQNHPSTFVFDVVWECKENHIKFESFKVVITNFLFTLCYDVANANGFIAIQICCRRKCPKTVKEGLNTFLGATAPLR